VVDAPAEITLGLIEARIESSETIRGWVSIPYAELRVRAEDRLVWSPRLAIHAEDTTGGTRLSCRMQPEPDVWTAYIALWSIVGAIAIGVTMYGLSQWVVGGPPWVMLIGFPAVIVMAIALYLGALLGQRRGAAQMNALERELHAALAGAVDELPRAPTFGDPEA